MIPATVPAARDYTVFGSISEQGLRVLDKVDSAGADPVSAQQTGDGTGSPHDSPVDAITVC